MYKKADNSESWKAFFKDLQELCQVQGIDIYDIITWIDDSLGPIEKENFDYHISSGPVPDEPSQKMDIDILLGDKIYIFTMTAAGKNSVICPVNKFSYYEEEITGSFIKATFYGQGFYVFVNASVANSSKLRQFAHKVLDLAWGK